MLDNAEIMPQSFVYIKDIIRDIEENLIFATNDNLLGKPLLGYYKAKSILTVEAAIALKKVNNELLKSKYKIKIYDAYRPTKAMMDFYSWKNSSEDLNLKNKYYPNLTKKQLFSMGYIATKYSSHSRGSTVDLTLVDLDFNLEINMGSIVGFLDKKSGNSNKKLIQDELRNREYLRKVMNKYGFIGIDQEWWHFTLKDEPYPNIYFNFDIK